MFQKKTLATLISVGLAMSSSFAVADPEVPDSPFEVIDSLIQQPPALSASDVATALSNGHDALTHITNTGGRTYKVLQLGTAADNGSTLDLSGLNGFYLSGGMTAGYGALTTAATDLTVRNIGDYLYYVANGSTINSLTFNFSEAQAEGRLLWIAEGGQTGRDGYNEGVINNSVLISNTIAITNAGLIAGTYGLTNNGTIQAADTAIENLNTGVIRLLINKGIISANQAIYNAGTIQTLTNSGTIEGTINNAGLIGNFTNTATGEISDIINAGEMLLNNQGRITGTLTNNKFIAGGLTNSGTIQSLVNGTGANIDVVMNTGTIADITIEAGGSIDFLVNSGSLTGQLVNNGTLGSLQNQAGGTVESITNNGVMELANAGTINGTVTNTGNISALVNLGTMQDINNAAGGNIKLLQNDVDATINSINNSGTVAINNGGTITDGITNTGTISGGLYNAGYLGSFTNSGDLDRMVNAGVITGDLINTGTVTGSIINTGTIEGNADIGSANFAMVGDVAHVGGNITGDSNSTLTLGDASDKGNYTTDYNPTDGDITVGKLAIAQNNTLTVLDKIKWNLTNSEAADVVSNAGTLVLNNASSVDHNLTNTGLLTLSNEQNTSATINGNVTNSGSLVLNPTATSAGNTLTINGDYNGLNGGAISLGTVVGGDDSLTDLLVINGNTSGTTSVYVTNEGGTGALSDEGIKLINITGNSDGVFTLGRRVVAGAYDYHLSKGNNSGSDTNDWYLSSSYGSDGLRAYRPEAAAYTSNLAASNELFNLRMREHNGETRYMDPLTGEVKTTSMWMRNEGGHSKTSMADGQNKTTANRYVLQIGGDLATGAFSSDDALHLGVMGGYANQKGNSINSLTGHSAKSSINGYSAGVYGTWYQNDKAKTGLYVDSWLQYNWFNNEVKGQDFSPETYDSHGLTASLEAGYSVEVASWSSDKGMTNTLFIEPQAQATWMGVKAKDHADSNNTLIQGKGNDNVQTRLGVRAYLNGKSVLDNNTVREFQPFIEANWIANTQQYGVRMNGVSDSATGTRNIGELKAGVEGRLSQNLSVWGDVAQQMGDKSYSDTQGTLGIKYQF